jgi:cytochrome b
MTARADAAGLAAGSAIRLWDLPVRLVHWLFVLLIPALWLSAENGLLDIHMILGLVMLGLVVFRLLWGFVGSSPARFSAFLKGPRAVRAYLSAKGEGAPVVGHNPLGGWSVLALLGLLALQVTLGLFAQDTDGVASGPLNHLVSWDAAKAITEAHEIAFNLIVALVALHVAAILWYRLVKRDDLIRPMLTGRRSYAGPVDAPRMAPAWRAVLCALLAAGAALWLAYGLPPFATAFPWDQPAAAAPGTSEADYM